VHSPSVRRSLLCRHCSSMQFQSSECFRSGTMGDGKVRVMDLACRGGSLEDRVSAVCKRIIARVRHTRQHFTVTCTAVCTKDNALPTCCASFRLRDHSYFGWGDDTGRVSVARLDVIWHNCDGQLGCHAVPTSFGVKVTSHQVHHSDAVTRLEYWTDIGMFVTSGKDGTLRYTEPDRVLNTLARAREKDKNTARWTLKAYKKQHLHGIFGFARSEKHNVIATWGLEREAFVWNPYSQQPMAQLDGHGCSVMSVVFNDATDQVITASSADKNVRIWCATTFTLTQVDCLSCLFGGLGFWIGEVVIASLFCHRTSLRATISYPQTALSALSYSNTRSASSLAGPTASFRGKLSCQNLSPLIQPCAAPSTQTGAKSSPLIRIVCYRSGTAAVATACKWHTSF
jgi:WD40 repeat protein